MHALFKSSLQTFKPFIRCLSNQEAAAALRPFYFSVHPDLFGRYPKARVINEDSLKKLHEYINTIQSSKVPPPISLLFYLKCQAGAVDAESEHLQAVRISLLSQCAYETVRTILKSSNLSLEYISNLQPSDKPNVNRPIKWSNSFYTAHGISNPGGEKGQAKTIETLSEWLSRNLAKAKQNLSKHEAIVKKTHNVEAAVTNAVGVNRILWCSKWSYTQFRGCLHGFQRLYERNRQGINLNGKTLVFGTVTGIGQSGEIILSADDVPDHWLNFLRTHHNYDIVLHKLPVAENHLSSLLGGVRIIRKPRGVLMLAEVYLSHLRKLSSALKNYYEGNRRLHDKNCYGDLEISIELGQSPLHLQPSGQILVPSTCPVPLLLDFLEENAEKAVETRSQYLSKKSAVHRLTKQCIETLGLKGITQDPNVTLDQFERCCEKLLLDPASEDLFMTECCVKVGQFYSVMSDGEICIPWFWKGVLDG